MLPFNLSTIRYLTITYAVLIPRLEEPQHNSDGATSAANPTTETRPPGPKPRHVTQKPAPIPKATRNSKGAKVKVSALTAFTA